MRIQRKKILLARIIIIALALTLTGMIWIRVNPKNRSISCSLEMDVVTDHAIDIQFFYSAEPDFSDWDVENVSIHETGIKQHLSVPMNVATDYIRIDLGDDYGNVWMSGLSVIIDKYKKELSPDVILNPIFTSNINTLYLEKDDIHVSTLADDPYIVIHIEGSSIVDEYTDSLGIRYLMYRIIISVWIILFACFCLNNIKTIFRTPLDMHEDREMFWDLAKNDFQAKFSGSYLGVFWGFVQPIILLFMYWFVFQYAMKSGRVVGYPFILYLMAGLIPWLFFSESWASATNSLLEYSYLVKKVVFKVNLLPVIKVMSSSFIYIFFLAILLIVCCLFGYFPDIYYLQLIYYAMLLVFFSLGMSYITASCTVFFRDMSQIVNIFLTVGVWFTPIMWNISMLGPELQVLFKLNPMFYIVDGVRDSLLAKVFFWEKPIWTVYSISFIAMIYILGVKLYNRLKVHFADVL